MEGKRRRVASFALCAVGVSAASGVSVADPGLFSAGVGYDYTTGRYGGTQAIDETYVPFSAAYRLDQWGAQVTVPYTSVSGPAMIIDSTTGEFAPGRGGTHSGLGDIIAGLTYYDLLRSDELGFYLDATARVKFGTANEAEGLGTGKNDYSVQLNALKEIGPIGLFASAGYLWRGSPAAIQLRSVGFGSVGADVRMTEGMRAGFTYGYRPAAIAGLPAVQELSGFMAFSLTRGLVLSPYVLGGFSDSSPSWGAGLSLSWKLPM